MKIIFSFSFLIAMFSLASQDIEVKWGNNLAVMPPYGDIKGINNNGFYVVAKKDNDHLLEYYTWPEGKQEFSKKITFPRVSKAENKYEYFWLVNDKIIFFVKRLDKETNRVILDACTFDLNGEMQSGKELVSVQVADKDNPGDFYFSESPDHSKVLVYYAVEIKKEDTENTFAKVIDQSLNTLSELLQAYPLKENDMSVTVHGQVVDNSGNLYMFKVKKNSKDKSLREHYLLSYAKGLKDKMHETNIGIKDTVLHNIRLFFDKDNNLAMAASYCVSMGTLRGAFYSTKGLYFMKMDAKAEKVTSKSLAIMDEEMIKNTVSFSHIGLRGGYPANFYPDNIFQPANGEIIITSEITVPSSTANYFYEDILVSLIDRNGKIKWLHLIPKKQVYKASGMPGPGMVEEIDARRKYYSYLTGVGNKDVCLIFNDKPKNLSISSGPKMNIMQDPGQSIPVLISISRETGEVRKKEITAEVGKDVILAPGIYFQNASDEITVFGFLKKQKKFGKIKIH